MSISTIIAKKLKEKGITHRKFYSDLQLPNNSLAQWEKRKTIPSGLILYNIASYLECRIEDILEKERLN